MAEINGYNNMIDITHLIIPEENTKYFNEEESIELYETCFDLMEELILGFPSLITEPDFEDIFDENINELIYSHFDQDLFYTEEVEEEIDEIIIKAKEDFFKYIIPLRSFSDNRILEEPDFDFLDEQLNYLRNKLQPIQRTKEWYEFRHNLITASNAYKAFENQTVKNQLIYEKCLPLNQNLFLDNEESIENEEDNKEIIMVNINTTLHWGQKYEPLSVKIYEHLYDTKIEDFGCIKHEKYSFLGASPDGINVDKNSKRYGRMLEIKNIVNREIDGIPKKEYWIQMQLQMEVCDLDECDFLETKFIEYNDFETYFNDTIEDIYEDNEGKEFLNIGLSKENKMKGEIIYFHTKEGKPFYVYKPLNLIHPDDIEKWQEDIVEYYTLNKDFNYTYMKTIYWKLDHLSCVLVCRNRQWFKDNISILEELWLTIEKERVSGFDHRAPNRKPKKEIIDISTKPSGNGCLLQFNKETGKISVIKKDSIIDTLSELKNINIKFNENT